MRRVWILLAALLLLSIACSAADYLSADTPLLEQGIPVAESELTPIVLPARWTQTATLSPVPTRTKTLTPTPSPTVSFQNAATPYALETLGPAFTLANAAITTADLPAGFTSFSMQDLLGEMMTGMVAMAEGFAGMFPEESGAASADPLPETIGVDFYNSMNFTMLANESSGTVINSMAYLFNDEVEQVQFDQQLEQDIEEFPLDSEAPEGATVYEFTVLTGLEGTGDVSQAVEVRMGVLDENGVEQIVTQRMVNFRRGPVGAMLMVLEAEGAPQVGFTRLAGLLDQRIRAALDAVSYTP